MIPVLPVTPVGLVGKKSSVVEDMPGDKRLSLVAMLRRCQTATMDVGLLPVIITPHHHHAHADDPALVHNTNTLHEKEAATTTATAPSTSKHASSPSNALSFVAEAPEEESADE